MIEVEGCVLRANATIEVASKAAVTMARCCWALLPLVLGTAVSGCAGVDTKQDLAVDAELRERAPRSARKQLGHVHVGDYAIMKLNTFDEAYNGEGGTVAWTVNGAGRAVSQSRTLLDLEHSPTHVSWSTDCTSRFERVGVRELEGVMASQSTEHRIACKVVGPQGGRWLFKAERTGATNFEGTLKSQEEGGSFNTTVVLTNRLGGSMVVPTVHLRRGGAALAGSVMLTPERVWLDPSLSEEEAGAAAAFMLALRYVDYTSKEEDGPQKEKKKGSFDVLGDVMK